MFGSQTLKWLYRMFAWTIKHNHYRLLSYVFTSFYYLSSLVPLSGSWHVLNLLVKSDHRKVLKLLCYMERSWINYKSMVQETILEIKGHKQEGRVFCMKQFVKLVLYRVQGKVAIYGHYFITTLMMKAKQ